LLIKTSVNWFFFACIGVFLAQCRNSKNTVIVELDSVHLESNFELEKVELGRKLFFDKRLSSDETVSCSSCHLPEMAFTDGLKVSVGVEGRLTERNSPSLLNSGDLPTVMFDGHLPTLEQQVIVPIQEHVEMNMNMLDLITKLKGIPEYSNAAKECFNREFDPWVLTRAISAFERSLTSKNSPFDKYYSDNESKAISKSAKRGWKIFSEDLYCTNCHPAPNFTTYETINNGLYMNYGTDKGRFRIFNDSNDIGKFKIPSLRNITLTAPYMHDGSKASIYDVIDHYSRGGESHKLKDKRITSFKLSDEQENDLINFFSTLVDTSYMKNYY